MTDDFLSITSCPAMVEKLNAIGGNTSRLVEGMTQIWFSTTTEEKQIVWDSHSRIGEPKSETHGEEQRGLLTGLPEKKMIEILSLNGQYENIFGFKFIICAAGRTGDEVISNMRLRITQNSKEEEDLERQRQHLLIMITRLCKGRAAVWKGKVGSQTYLYDCHLEHLIIV